MTSPDTRNLTTELIDRFFESNRQIKEYEKDLEKMKKVRTAIQLDIMDHMETDGVDQIRSERGGTVFKMRPKIRISLKKDMKEDAYTFLKEEWGLSDLFSETISMATLGKIAEEKILEGDDPPENLFGIYYDKKLGHRSA